MASEVRRLSFSDSHLEAVVVENAVDFRVDGIVVNLSSDPVRIGSNVPTLLPAWRSTILTDTVVRQAERLAVLRVAETKNLGGVAQRGWTWFGDVYAGFPRTTPLYVSSKDIVGQARADPRVFSGQSVVGSQYQDFDIHLKCWWSPGQTDCFIHNEHPFMEIHTQIHGLGRMQKFERNDVVSRYEDVVMAPGMTHEPFLSIQDDDGWKYPWHRYFADDESIWLAIELHPRSN